MAGLFLSLDKRPWESRGEVYLDHQKPKEKLKRKNSQKSSKERKVKKKSQKKGILK